MQLTSRRAFLFGALSTLAAPAVIRTTGLLMPVRPFQPQNSLWLGKTPDAIFRDVNALLYDWFQQQPRPTQLYVHDTWLPEIPRLFPELEYQA